jgi:hypothetical protein
MRFFAEELLHIHSALCRISERSGVNLAQALPCFMSTPKLPWSDAERPTLALAPEMAAEYASCTAIMAESARLLRLSKEHPELWSTITFVDLNSTPRRCLFSLFCSAV